MQTQIMLKLREVKKSYASHLILNIPELNLSSGIYWLRGKNGSGKTTLMKIIAGQIPFEGLVELHDISLTSDPVLYRKQISYAEAEPLYPGFLTGTELLKFVQKIRKADKQLLKTVIDVWNIGGFTDNRIETYSSGMVKKLSLALAFLGQPKFILLDEPLITLEDAALPILFQLMRDRLREGASFMITSHQAFPEDELILAGKVMVENQTATIE
jgi:ABC-2 type transport system ATP-binding protein